MQPAIPAQGKSSKISVASLCYIMRPCLQTMKSKEANVSSPRSPDRREKNNSHLLRTSLAVRRPTTRGGGAEMERGSESQAPGELS